MFKVVCDECGVEQEAAQGNNPVNPKTGEKWFSRTVYKKHEDSGFKYPVAVKHACSRLCRNRDGVATLPW